MDWTNTTGMPPRRAAELARDGEIDGAALLRALTTWPGWLVPGAERGPTATSLPVLVTPEGHRVLECFSDQRALDEFAARPDVEPGVAALRPSTFRGDELYAGLASSVVLRVSLDQHSPHGMSYQGDRVDELARWAGVAHVERALREPGSLPDAAGVLLAFRGWHVVLRTGGGPESMVLAPDESRTLGAAFSAPDTAAAFVAHAMDSLPGELKIETVDGRTLFSRLLAMRLDGVVFNPLGPLEPRAFHATLFERLLSRTSVDA